MDMRERFVQLSVCNSSILVSMGESMETSHGAFADPLQRLPLSLLAAICGLLNDRERAAMNRVSRRAREASSLPHAWHAIRTPYWISCFSEMHTYPLCDHCQSWLHFWNKRVASRARPVHVSLFETFHTLGVPAHLSLPSGDRVRSLTMHRALGAEWLAHLPQLTALDITLFPDYTGALPPAAPLRRLRASVVGDPRAFIQGIKAASALHTLHLDGKEFLDADVQALVQCGLPITDLRLCCHLSDAAALHLACLPLKSLALASPMWRFLLKPVMTDAFLRQLTSLELAVLELPRSITHVESTAPIVLASLSRLTLRDGTLLAFITAPRLVHVTLEYGVGIRSPGWQRRLPALTSMDIKQRSLALEQCIPPPRICRLTRVSVPVLKPFLQTDMDYLLQHQTLCELALWDVHNIEYAQLIEQLRKLNERRVRVTELDWSRPTEAELEQLAPMVPHLQRLIMRPDAFVTKSFLRKTFGDGLKVTLRLLMGGTRDLDVTEYDCPKWSQIGGLAELEQATP